MKYWLFIVVGLLGCNGNLTSHSGKTLSGRDKEIEYLVSTLRFSDCAYFGGIGFEGKESPVYEAYKKLLKIAPDSLWIRLSYNDKPVARLYALEALAQKKSPWLESVRQRLKNDTAAPCWVADDMSQTFSISFYVAMCDTSKERRNNYLSLSTIESRIPSGADISPENMYNAIYELRSDSLENCTVLTTRKFAFITTFEDLGQGTRTNLYVIDLAHRSFVRDADFQRDFLYSSAGIFVIDTSKGRIFSVDAPALYDSKQEIIVPASLYLVKGRYFHFIKNVYEIGRDAPNATALLAFYKGAISTRSRGVFVLPKDWWR